MDPGQFALHMEHGLGSKDWSQLERTMILAPAFTKPVTFCYLNSFLLVAGERAIYHVRTRLSFRVP